MAEETEGQDTGAEASGAGVDPAAVALALGGASRERADAIVSLSAWYKMSVRPNRQHTNYVIRP